MVSQYKTKMKLFKKKKKNKNKGAKLGVSRAVNNSPPTANYDNRQLLNHLTVITA
jgi:hypothetical protein